MVVLIEDSDGFRRALEQGCEVNILLLERVVERLSIGDVDCDPDGSRNVSVGAAQWLDARLEGSAAPIHFVPHQLALQGSQMRGEGSEPWITALQDLVERHSDLIAAGRPDQIETRSLRKRDVEPRVSGPKIDGH